MTLTDLGRSSVPVVPQHSYTLRLDRAKVIPGTEPVDVSKVIRVSRLLRYEVRHHGSRRFSPRGLLLCGMFSGSIRLRWRLVLSLPRGAFLRRWRDVAAVCRLWRECLYEQVKGSIKVVPPPQVVRINRIACVRAVPRVKEQGLQRDVNLAEKFFQ